MFEIGEMVRCGNVIGEIVGVRYDCNHAATWTIVPSNNPDYVITAETDEIEPL